MLGLDLAESAVQRASAIPTRSGVSYRIGDFLALPDGDQFDWIFEHTCFCAIDPTQRPAYMRAAAGALKAGGHLLAIFYLNPHDPGEDHTGPPHGATLVELDALFDPAFELVEDYVPARAYAGREGRERLRLYRKRADSGV